MIVSPMSGAAKALAPFALALALTSGSRAALAQPASDADAPADPASSAEPTTRESAAPTPDAKPTPGAASVRSSTEASPIPAATAPKAEASPASWFARAPLTISIGEGTQKWALTFYGFVEADYIADSTRSYGEAIGNSLVARNDTYAGRVGRTQFTMRNTRLGFKFEAPETGGVKSSATLEGDFYGPSSLSSTSENSVYTSPTFRVRHAYLSLRSDYVDVIAGQTYDVFGWQNYFFPCSAEFLGLPNQVFSRNPQFRLSHTFGAHGPVSVDLAVSAVRPAQRDSSLPDANAGLRLSVEGFQGITTPGSSGTVALPLSIGVSGVARRFRVNSFTPAPAQSSNTTTGWGVSIDALIPIIPATNANDRGNKLTLTGSFVTGTGIGDLITSGGGATFPTLPNPTQSNPPPEFNANIDNGLVSYDLRGVLHGIDWQAFKVGLQYYLPPSGRVIFSANYTYSHSKNLNQLFLQGGTEIELLGSVADTSQYADANLFWDATPAVRLGISGQYTKTDYLAQQGGNRQEPHNIRGMALALYAF